MGYKEVSLSSEKALEKANADLDQGADRPSRVGAAIALWVDGAPLSEIAELLGYSSATQARQAIEKGLASTLADEDGKEKARFKANRRLERMLRPLWKRIEDPDDPENLPAIRAGLSITDRIIRLNGADAAQEMIVYNPSTAELDAWLAERARAIRGQVPDEVDIIEGYVVQDTGEGDGDD
jgi:hypothetical protein